MLALVLAVGCGGADKKNKEAERPDDGLGVDGIYEVGDYYNENGKEVDIAYKVGDYYNENGKEGVVFVVTADGRHGKIVSLDEARGLAWDSRLELNGYEYINGTKTGANYNSDGKANTNKVMKRDDSDQYPAFVWCQEKGEDWYLPAKDEFKAIYNNKSKINSTLAKYGAKLSDGYWYWSSTEDEGDPEFSAWCVMIDGDTNRSYKHYNRYVRAVSAF